MKLPAALSSFKPGKNWIVLGVALVVGVMAALAARGYLARQMAEIESRVVNFLKGEGRRPAGTLAADVR